MDENTKKKLNIIVIGMAGSGKSTFVGRYRAVKKEQQDNIFAVNLDPAVSRLSFEADLDIRDGINFKEVMRQYELGPNGGIMTCLNIFATKLDKFHEALERRRAATAVVDTPGQIEVFTWSASGELLTSTMALSGKTVILYIMDGERCEKSPITFMSNMLHACSIMFRNMGESKRELYIVINKADQCNVEKLKRWMEDFDEFQRALDEESDSYIHNFMRSVSLVLDEFYSEMRVFPVSSMTGHGFAALVGFLES